jgi:hypothetical protein
LSNTKLERDKIKKQQKVLIVTDKKPINKSCTRNLGEKTNQNQSFFSFLSLFFDQQQKE